MGSTETREIHEISHEGPVFYIDNTLVPAEDGCRLLGPYNNERLEQKRQVYEHLMRRLTQGMGETDREEFMRRHPFGVYKVETDLAFKAEISITSLEM